MNFQAYHGVNGAQHQAHFNTLSAQGYRMISLRIYGYSNSPLYAAVWVQRGGPAWVAAHGIDAAAYAAYRNSGVARWVAGASTLPDHYCCARHWDATG
jgi:hypothetical protein